MNHLPFTPEEYQARLTRVRQRMSKIGLDALILTRPANIYYLTGYKAAVMNWTLPLLPLIVPLTGEMSLMSRQIEGVTIKHQLAERRRTYMDHENPYLMMAEMVRDSGVFSGRIGIEETSLNVAQHKQFRLALPDAELIDTSGLVEKIRITLSGAEIDYFRQAAKITNNGFRKGAELLSVGVHPYELIAEMQKTMYSAGQTDVEVPKMWIWSGPEGGLMHDTDITRPINKNDLATIEVWGTTHQYLVGTQATYFIGPRPPKAVSETQKLLADMYLAAIDALKPGTVSADIYHAANAVYRKAYGKDYWRRIGANMGLTFGPVDMGMNGQDVLEIGTPFILQLVETEPALVTSCATVLMTDNGVEELTPPGLTLFYVDH